MSVALPGPFNVSNALAALVTLSVAGVPAVDAAAGIAGLSGVPGRMERVDVGTTVPRRGRLRPHTRGRRRRCSSRWALRWPARSSSSSAAAATATPTSARPWARRLSRGADLVVLTSDNPRSEDPLLILDAMRAGAEEAAQSRPGTELVVEPDRAAAVALAVGRAVPGGAVVVAGKGHETGQETGGVVVPFDDREVLREVLAPWSP